jgi:hypothetical protein
MDILNKIKTWAGLLADTGVSIIALAIVLEVLFKGTSIPFFPTVSVTSNVTAIVSSIGSQGLVGLIAVWVLYGIWKNK